MLCLMLLNCHQLIYLKRQASCWYNLGSFSTSQSSMGSQYLLSTAESQRRWASILFGKSTYLKPLKPLCVSFCLLLLQFKSPLLLLMLLLMMMLAKKGWNCHVNETWFWIETCEDQALAFLLLSLEGRNLIRELKKINFATYSPTDGVHTNE